MINESEISEKIARLAEPLLESAGMELVDIEYRREQEGWVLRLFIDMDGGVNLDDCARVSREIGNILDSEDLIPHEYNLEVSSPGLNRPLKKETDFKRFAGRLAKVKTSAPVEGSKNFKGRIVGCEDGIVTLEVDRVERKIPVSLISKANIEFEF